MSEVHPFVLRIRALVTDPRFQSTVLMLIVLNALFLGAEATPALDEVYAAEIELVLTASLWLFVIEILLRLAAHLPHPARYFHSSWNRFDFIVVALSLVPTFGGFAVVGRVLRVLRLLRAFTVAETLRGFFHADDGDRPLTILWQWAAFAAVFGYCFALSGVYMFGPVDAERWGSLALSVASLGEALRFSDTAGLLAGGAALKLPLLGFIALFYLVLFSLTANAAWQIVRALRAGPAGDR